MAHARNMRTRKLPNGSSALQAIVITVKAKGIIRCTWLNGPRPVCLNLDDVCFPAMYCDSEPAGDRHIEGFQERPRTFESHLTCTDKLTFPMDEGSLLSISFRCNRESQVQALGGDTRNFKCQPAQMLRANGIFLQQFAVALGSYTTRLVESQAEQNAWTFCKFKTFMCG